MAKNRGNRPNVTNEKVPGGHEPKDFGKEHPKFCLRHVQKNFDVDNLTTKGQAELARTLQRLASITWNEIQTSQRHGLGTEKLAKSMFKTRIPLAFEDREDFTAFRYHENRPMVGVRVRDVFQVIWIEADYGDLYKH